MQRIRTAAIFFAFLSLYLMSTGTPFYSSDSQVMYESARSIALNGRFDIPPMPLPQVITGQDGRSYGKYDPGVPLLAAPLVSAADRIASNILANRYAVAAVFVMLVPALFMALAIASLFALAQRLYTFRRALVIALVAGLGTTAWPYARLFFAEAVLTGALALTVLLIASSSTSVAPSQTTNRRAADSNTVQPMEFQFAERAFRSVRLRCRDQRLTGITPPTSPLLIASLVMGIGILSRASMIVYLPGIVYLLWQPIDGRWRRLLLIAIGPTLALAGVLWHNELRFGDPFQNGYSGEGFSTLPWVGAFGLLFSPGKSVFIYAPPLIVSAGLFPRFRQRHPRLANAMLIMTASALSYFGTWWAWHGGWVWGPRFLVPLITLWCLPWGEFPRRKASVALGILIFVLGIGVQVIGTFTDVTPAYAEVFQGADNPGDESRYAMVHYSPGKAPLVAGIRRAGDGIWEKPALYRLDSTGLTPLWTRDMPRAIYGALGFSIAIIGWAWFRPGTGRKELQDKPTWRQKDRNSTTAARL